MTDQAAIDVAECEAVEETFAPTAADMVDLMLDTLWDGLDHPEIWSQIGVILDRLPELPTVLTSRIECEPSAARHRLLMLLLLMCFAARGHVDFALEQIEPIAVANSQSAQVQGAVFYLRGLQDPENPKYKLKGKICPSPFVQLDVLDRSSHLCCASWLRESAGNLSISQWQDVWNSDMAQNIRASVHDGSYRYCNKMACPKIQADLLAPAEDIAAESDLWRQIIELKATHLPVGPEQVNLAYDRTCNLSCPSCRTEKYAADEATRLAYDDMQRTKILPLLKEAKTVFVTGSGDPFASKNFRRLMLELTPEDYPGLTFEIMTNGMLFTRKQWEAFPTLHGRTHKLRISIDAATGPTHELLRRGARWPVMLENMAFAGELTAQGLISDYDLVFTVQAENFHEMGDAVDLAKRMGARLICFSRITNWGTFSDVEYANKAVFLPSHPDHAAFLEAVQDPRLRDPIVMLGDISAFLCEPATRAV